MSRIYSMSSISDILPITLRLDRELMRACKMRDIMLASIQNQGTRNEAPSPFHSGDELSFEYYGRTVRATVFFDPGHIEVRLTSPVSITTGWNVTVTPKALHYRPYLSMIHPDDKDRAATPECLRQAWVYLEELFCDYWIADSTRETLCSLYERYLTEERETREREMEFNTPILREIDALRKEKTLLKRRFKEGLFTEMAYKEERRRLLDMIEAKEATLLYEDVFGRVFYDHLLRFQCVENSRELIRGIAEGKL